MSSNSCMSSRWGVLLERCYWLCISIVTICMGKKLMSCVFDHLHIFFYFCRPHWHQPLSSWINSLVSLLTSFPLTQSYLWAVLSWCPLCSLRFMLSYQNWKVHVWTQSAIIAMKLLPSLNSTWRYSSVFFVRCTLCVFQSMFLFI